MVGLTSPYEYLKAVVAGAGDERVLVLKGEVDLHTAPLLAERIAELIAAGLRPVVVDMADVTFLDSCGIDALCRAYEALDRRPEALVLLRPSPIVRRVLELAGVDSLFTLREG